MASSLPAAALQPLCGSGGSLLDVHGLCECGHTGIYDLSVTLGISKDIIPFSSFYIE